MIIDVIALVGSFGAILIFVGVIFLFYFIFTYNWKRSQVSKVFRRYPFTRIADVKDGDYVKVQGVIWDGGEKIIAPLSERQCVYYHIEVSQKVGGKNRSWVTLFEEEVMGDVIIKSDNCFAVIEADSPLAHLLLDLSYTSGFLNDASPNLEKYLKKHGHDPTDWIGLNKTIVAKEGVLRRGERLAVAGRARWISSSGLKFKVPAKNVLLISETDADNLFMSEDPTLVNNELYKGSK